jgi:hypothetical protein
MKTSLLIILLCSAIALQTRAESTFTGSFFAIQNTSLIAGDISLTVDEGQVSFKCMLLSYIPTTNIEAFLTTGPKELPVSLGVGTQGTWPLQEFLWPGSGSAPFNQGGIDPGSVIPPTADGTSFAGTFPAPRHLEHLLLARGGTVYLQIHGAVEGMQDPILSATLLNVTPIHFSALCTGREEIPPNTSRHRATAQFTLTKNIFTQNVLAYTYTTDPGFAWSLAGIYGPAAQHSKALELFAQFDTSFGVIAFNPGQPTAPSGIIYSGTVSLTDEQATDLKRGLCYLNFLTTRYPKGEIRGQIRCVPAPQEKRPNEH